MLVAVVRLLTVQVEEPSQTLATSLAERPATCQRDDTTATATAHFYALDVPAVSVLEVECVREGCQSEMLRRMAGSVPEARCLTVVFKGPRKSLDLLCQSQEEAQHWVRGIRTLQERVENMTEKEKLDQYPAPVLPVR